MHNTLLVTAEQTSQAYSLLSGSVDEDSFPCDDAWLSARIGDELLNAESLVAARAEKYEYLREELIRLLPKRKKELEGRPVWPSDDNDDDSYLYDHTARCAKAVKDGEAHLVKDWNDVSAALIDVDAIVDLMKMQ